MGSCCGSAAPAFTQVQNHVSTGGPLISEGGLKASTATTFSLVYKLYSAHTVAFGTVEKVIRRGYTPLNAVNSINQHTVFAFKPDRYLLVDKGGARKHIKVTQHQGDLPWEFLGKKGVGRRISNEPMLQVGERYLLFLVNPAIRAGRMTGEHKASFAGVYGKAGDLDEYILDGSGVGAFLIRDGQLVLPVHDLPELSPLKSWSFETGTPKTMVGMMEEQAVSSIEQAHKEMRELFLREKSGGVDPP